MYIYTYIPIVNLKLSEYFRSKPSNYVTRMYPILYFRFII